MPLVSPIMLYWMTLFGACNANIHIEQLVYNIKVARSSILMSFKNVSFVEYACQIWCLYLLLFKISWPRLKFFFFLPQSHRKTDGEAEFHFGCIKNCHSVNWWPSQSPFLLSTSLLAISLEFSLLNLLLCHNLYHKYTASRRNIGLTEVKYMYKSL